MPSFCQDCDQDFLKIDVNVIGGGGGVAANLQRSRGCGQKIFIYAPLL